MSTNTPFQEECVRYWDWVQENQEVAYCKILAELGVVATPEALSKLGALAWVYNNLGQRTGYRVGINEAAKKGLTP